MTRARLLAVAIRLLDQSGVPGAARDARLLLRWAGGHDAAHLGTILEDEPEAEEAARFQAAVQARANRVPLSHLTGSRSFWGRSFRVTPDVLDPRPETETLVALALGRGPVRRVLDLGVGSGCILLTLLAEWPGTTGLGIDNSAAALDVARQNAAALGLADRVDLRLGDWLDGVSGPFDLVVANPPYLAEDELADLAPELGHEPQGALSPGGDGLCAYARIAAQVAGVLAPGGHVLLEIGPSQGPAVCALFQARGFGGLRVHPDFDGRDRVVSVGL